MSAEIKTLAIINDQKIEIIENGDLMVPIKPICEALGINSNKQREKIQEDEIIGSVGTLSVSTGSDGKQYEMYCIPFKYVFGWLFTINPKNVKDEAKKSVLQYRSICYDVLYDHFTASSRFVKERSEMVEKKVEQLETLRSEFNQSKKRLDAAKKELDFVRGVTFDIWKDQNGQLNIWETIE